MALGLFFRVNGFPHFDGRETTTVFGGIFQPAFRESWILRGLANQSPEPTTIGAFRDSARVVGCWLWQRLRAADFSTTTISFGVFIYV
jgi:hypothetical protein